MNDLVYTAFKTIACKFSILLLAVALNTTAFAADWKLIKNADPMPAFELRTQHGDVFTNESLIDQWSLVLVGFTSCPDVCPYTLGNLAHVIEETSFRVTPKTIPKVVFLAVDPDRDQLILSGYVNHFNQDFVGVTGDKDDIDLFVDGLDAFYKFEKMTHSGGQHDHGAYNVIHSADVRVLNPKGKLVATLTTPMSPNKVAEFLLKLQVEYRKSLGSNQG